MMSTAADVPPAEPAQASYAQILPVVGRTSRRWFSSWPRRRREDAFHDARQVAWLFTCRLQGRGKDPVLLREAVARHAAAWVRSGRTVVGQDSDRDVLSDRGGDAPRVVSLQARSTGGSGATWENLLAGGRHEDPAEIAAVRIDFAAWLDTLSRSQRRAAEVLAQGFTTTEAATRLGCRPGRVSQLRRELYESWPR
jgi:hypothetical protein